MDEFQCREVAGVACNEGSIKGWTLAYEQENSVCIGVNGATLYMKPAAAHRLATMLHRLARRIEARKHGGDDKSSRAGE